jgi:hypothetical protein
MPVCQSLLDLSRISFGSVSEKHARDGGASADYVSPWYAVRAAIRGILYSSGEKTMPAENIDELLAKLRQLLRAQYDRGGQDALKRFSGSAKGTPNRSLRTSSKPAVKSARGPGRSAVNNAG